MRHRIPLPDELGHHFTLRQAEAAGIGRHRASARDLERPFHGVRSITAPATPLQRVAALAPRLRQGQLIGGETAMRMWGCPHPGLWDIDDPLIVVVTTGSARIRSRGIIGRRLADGRARTWHIGDIPIVDPVTALFMCAGALSSDEIVVAIDALITASDNYPGLRTGRPRLTVTDIEHHLRLWGRFPGSRRVRDALPRARDGVESPKETETRLLIVDGGFPEPEVQYEIREGGRLVARTDLAYPDLRITIEYEGDGHRTSRTQWRRDIQRQRELEDLGWIVIRVTQLDLAERGRSLLDRIRRAIASR
ncbi:hypothetical protein HWD99_17280 [Microbacterium sp. C5A9]|uniref:endonuclease domain-containing protein n=1 Tax=Microbacterium sp. C5A9 TaxID=2736663 RepID=UPI001F527764|nr:hypothetical protein [Microbacterium sp. C5A9]MCI1020382.1 hypothetical protein [Microbacterium sp. C5A9]